MTRYLGWCWLLVAVSSFGGVCCLACEDEHPPTVSSPVLRYSAPDEAGVGILKLAFDPRGVTSVLPAGDKAATWIDTADRTAAWHYREWQWWKGHPFGDSCRPRFYSKLEFRAPKNNQRGAVISYRIDGFHCRQAFLLPETVPAIAPYWDLVTSIRNDTGRGVKEYAQFFACYTPLNRGRSFWYWDESGDLALFSERGVTHLDGYVAHPQAYFLEQGSIPHCPRGGGKVVGRWRRPVMVSHVSPAGWRSIIMIEARHAAALAQGINGAAMDYIVFPAPDQPNFANGDEFAVHIRHVMFQSTELPSIERLSALWSEFERAHASVRASAAQL